MPKRSLSVLAICLWVCAPAVPRQDVVSCGTHSQKAVEQLFLHRRAAALRPRPGLLALPGPATLARDIGDVAVIEDNNGDLITRNIAFDLDRRTVSFVPASAGAASYRYQTGTASYEEAAATAGARLDGLGDDDGRRIALPFAFPFYGKSYQQLFVNSDGNLTFDAAEFATSERSLGRMAAGPPRIAALFRDLDPPSSTQGVRVQSRSDHVVLSWAEVPEFSSFGTGRRQTFQIRLFPDGRIDLAYGAVSSTEAVVGISPGGGLGTTAVVSFSEAGSGEYTGTLAQRFNDLAEVDIFAAALKFYQTHEDAYDYLVLFNNKGVAASAGAIAYEVTARNLYRDGYGDEHVDMGTLFGSSRRLQAVMNMGPLGQYPVNLDAPVPGRSSTGDTPMTILGHEAGHLFLAFASIRDPDDASAKPMLKPDGAHWSFNFNSEASLLEGNRIQDNGDGTFSTTATVEGYSPLDQYLMGLLPQEEVPPTFLVANSSFPSSLPPSKGRTLRGSRRDIRIDEVVQAEGRRSPAPDVSQRQFRFAFILIVDGGSQPLPSETAQIEAYRSRFPDYYGRYAAGRASAETSLRRSLRLSTAPAAGLLAGGAMSATVSIEKPAATPLTVYLQRRPEAVFQMPASLTIAAGATSAAFQINGLAPGTDDLVAVPFDPQFETARARIRVAAGPSVLRMAVISGQGQFATPGTPMPSPVVLRVTDADGLPYQGLRVAASVSPGDSVVPAQATSDEDGLVRFQWTPGSGAVHELTANAEGAPPSAAITVAGLAAPQFQAAWVVNAASYASGLAPGGFASIFGFGLSAGVSAGALLPYPTVLGGVSVLADGKPAPLLYVSEGQINFLLPADAQPGQASLVVTTPVGSSPPVNVPVLAAAPGIFFDVVTGYGVASRNGGLLEFYCTGLGIGLPVKAYLGGFELPATRSPLFQGLDRASVQIPAGLAGEQTLTLEVDGRRSNQVKVRL